MINFHVSKKSIADVNKSKRKKETKEAKEKEPELSFESIHVLGNIIIKDINQLDLKVTSDPAVQNWLYSLRRKISVSTLY